MNLLQGDLGSDAWLVLSREFDKVVVIASYGEAVYKMKLEACFSMSLINIGYAVAYWQINLMFFLENCFLLIVS